MNIVRVIPRIDVKGPNVVKGIHLEGLRVLGTPNSFAKYYYEEGADEIIYMDVVASLYGRNSLLDLVKKSAEDVFIPITVGGGLRTISDVSEALKSGADKVCINTAAINDNSLVSRVADKFGSSTLVIAIEAIKQDNGKYHAFTDNGREETGMEVVEWAKKVEALGAGEILLTSVDNEGTGKGLDVELIESVVSELSIPLIAHGGVGKVEDVADTVLSTNINAVALSSILHYEAFDKIDSNKSEFKKEGNRNFLFSNRIVSHIEKCKISDLKEKMASYDISVRF